MRNVNMVHNNFLINKTPWIGRTARFRFIEFTPKTEQATAWAKERVHYLFGGSGKTNRGVSKDFDPETLKRYQEADTKKLLDVAEGIITDSSRVVDRAEESLLLMDGFLAYMDKPSLRLYSTSSIYGESRSYLYRQWMENGNDTARETFRLLRGDPPRTMWLAPHITPYVPYISMLFIRPDIADMKHYQEHFRRCTEDNVKIVPLELDGKSLLKKVAGKKDRFSRWSPPAYPLIHLWNDIQTAALSRIYGTATLYVKDECADGSTYFGKADLRHRGYYVFAVQNREKRALRFDSARGFAFSKLTRTWDITDFALISSPEMFTQGVFKFMMLDHEDSADRG